MIFKISKQDFLGPIQKVQSIVEKKTTFPFLQNVRIEAKDTFIKIFATDMDVSLRDKVEATVEEAGSITVSAHKLYEVLKELGDEIVHFEVDQNNWIKIECGLSNFRLVGLSDADFPSMMDIKEGALIDVDASILESLSNKSMYAATTDQNKHMYRGVLFKVNGNILTMVATDGHRLAKVTMKSEENLPDMEVIVPKKGITELLKIISTGAEKIALGIEKNNIVFRLNNQFTIARLIDAQFPDFERVIPQQNTYNIRINRPNFYDICKRVSIFSDIKTHTVSMTFGNVILEVKGSTPEFGEAKDQIVIDYEGEELNLNFNVMYILETLRVFECEEIFMRFNDGGPVIFEPVEKDTVDYLALIMPMII